MPEDKKTTEEQEALEVAKDVLNSANEPEPVDTKGEEEYNDPFSDFLEGDKKKDPYSEKLEQLQGQFQEKIMSVEEEAKKAAQGVNEIKELLTASVKSQTEQQTVTPETMDDDLMTPEEKLERQLKVNNERLAKVERALLMEKMRGALPGFENIEGQVESLMAQGVSFEHAVKIAAHEPLMNYASKARKLKQSGEANGVFMETGVSATRSPAPKNVSDDILKAGFDIAKKSLFAE